MTTIVLKYIFCGMLCLPFVAIALSILSDLIDQTALASSGKRKRKSKKELKQERLEFEKRREQTLAEIEKRRKFDEEYRKIRGI